MLHRYEGAILLIKDLGGGVIGATYSGAMTCECFLTLRERWIARSAGYDGAVVDVRRVVPLELEPSSLQDRSELSCTAPPEAFVVNVAQSDLWLRYAIGGAPLGYARAVFLRLPEALQWARDMASCTVDFGSIPIRNVRAPEPSRLRPLFDPRAFQADEPCPTEPAPLM